MDSISLYLIETVIKINNSTIFWIPKLEKILNELQSISGDSEIIIGKEFLEDKITNILIDINNLQKTNELLAKAKSDLEIFIEK